MSNPLLENTPLPLFKSIKPEHIEPAVDALLQQNREKIATLAQVETPTWENFVAPLEDVERVLDDAWSPVGHLNGVANTDELREAYNACLPKLSEYHTEIGQNQALFNNFKKLKESADFASYSKAQQRTIELAIQDFQLSGVDLPEAERNQYKQLSQELSQLTTKFSENVLDATQAWHKHISDEAELAGIPDSTKGLLAQYAAQRELDGWVVTLDFPSYLGVMSYADNRQLREEVYQAFGTRASDQGPDTGDFNNSPLMEEILQKRHSKAQLLGFNDYAELSVARKMAESPDEIIGFLNELGEKSKPAAQAELEALATFAKEELGLNDMQPWDVTYVSEKLRESKFKFTQEELRPYFPAPRVIDGLFQVAQRLFSISIDATENDNLWHDDARFFTVKDQNGQAIAQFYLDLYAREGKRGGAWMDECRTRGDSQLPVAYLVCNFAPPVGDQPSLLTHNEVETLFHEFGHGLHHMLTQVTVPSVSGIRGVPWDAVELPSQFLENWCWEREALDTFSGHVETGEKLPAELFDKMLAAKTFGAAMQMVRQLEFALFDLRIHKEFDPAQGGRVEQILDQVREQVAVIKPPAYNRFANSFSHIFAGGYAAGYYSYKWAEVLSADAFSRFEEEGVFNPETGASFKQNILEKGGSEEAMDLFVAFRGRKPDIGALLRHSGLTSEEAA